VFEIFINPAASGTQDFEHYARGTINHWAAALSHYGGFLDRNKEALDRTTVKLKAFIEKEKLNKHYKWHQVVYIGFPLALTDETVRDFVPFFSLSINYGAKESCVCNFLIK
jgi:hypothetical protein